MFDNQVVRNRIGEVCKSREEAVFRTLGRGPEHVGRDLTISHCILRSSA